MGGGGLKKEKKIKVKKVPSAEYRQYIEKFFSTRQASHLLSGISLSIDFIERCEGTLRACYPLEATPDCLDLCLTYMVVERQNSEPRLAPSIPRKLIEALLRELQHQYTNKAVAECPVCERKKKDLVYTDERKEFLKQIGHLSKKRTAPKIVSVLKAFKEAPPEFTYKDIVDLGNNSFKESTVRTVFSVLQFFGEVRRNSPDHAGAQRTIRYKTKEFGKSDIWKLEDGTGTVQWQYFQSLLSGKKVETADTGTGSGEASVPKPGKRAKETEK